MSAPTRPTITTLRSCTRDHLATTTIDITAQEAQALGSVIPGEYVLVRSDPRTPSLTEPSRHVLITRPEDQSAALAAIDAHLATFD